MKDSVGIMGKKKMSEKSIPVLKEGKEGLTNKGPA